MCFAGNARRSMPRLGIVARTDLAQPRPAVLDVRSASEWEQWLEANHGLVPEGVWLRLFRMRAPEATLEYSQAVHIALCFGWIDGQAKKHDDVSRVQRFTPRRTRSLWSKINTERAERLMQAGQLRPAGQHEVDAARADGRWAPKCRRRRRESPAPGVAVRVPLGPAITGSTQMGGFPWKPPVLRCAGSG